MPPIISISESTNSTITNFTVYDVTLISSHTDFEGFTIKLFKAFKFCFSFP